MLRRDEVDELPQWTRGLFRECGVPIATAAIALPSQHPTALHGLSVILGGRVCSAWQVVFEMMDNRDGELRLGERYICVHGIPLSQKETDSIACRNCPAPTDHNGARNDTSIAYFLVLHYFRENGANMVLFSNIVAVAVAFGTPILAARSAGCGKTPTLTGTGAHTLTIGGRARQYFLKMPPEYDNEHAYKVIFTLHALGGTASQVVAGQGGYLPWYGLPALDGNNTAIYLAPDGTNNGWANTGGADLAFLEAVLAGVEADLCVDTAHRYSTGFSYGGAMSYALACARPDAVRAVAVLSGGPMSGCVGGTQPVAWYNQHGVSDQVLPVALGRQMRDQFVRNNGCDAAPNVPEPARGSGAHVKTVYTGCRPGYPVTFVAFDGDHTPQPKDRGADATFSANETWAFFEQFKQE